MTRMSEKAEAFMELTARQVSEFTHGDQVPLFDIHDDTATDQLRRLSEMVEELASWCPAEVRMTANCSRRYLRKGDAIDRTLNPYEVVNTSYGSDAEDAYVITVNIVTPVVGHDRGPIALTAFLEEAVGAAIPPQDAKALEIEQLEARIAELKGL